MVGLFEGDVVGSCVGCLVLTFLVGGKVFRTLLLVGDRVGLLVGDEVGRLFVGDNEEGTADGNEEGTADGNEEGTADGNEERTADGNEERTADGNEERTADGNEERTAEHDSQVLGQFLFASAFWHIIFIDLTGFRDNFRQEKSLSFHLNTTTSVLSSQS